MDVHDGFLQIAIFDMCDLRHALTMPKNPTSPESPKNE